MSSDLANCFPECVFDREEDIVDEGAAACRFGPCGDFRIRIASSAEDRRRAWALAYEVYSKKEYARPDPQRLWYSLYDALPQTVTMLVERRGELIAAVTVVPDSPLGLPADTVFPAETQRLRDTGGRLAEAVSLVQAGFAEHSDVLVAAKLCEFTCLAAQRVLGATDLVITVNPHHVEYYRRVMLFERRGDEVDYGKVSGAPAVFLTLNFADMSRHMENASQPGAPRTLYRRFMKPAEAQAAAMHLRDQMCPLDDTTLRRYFMDERPLLTEASLAVQAHILCANHWAAGLRATGSVPPNRPTPADARLRVSVSGDWALDATSGDVVGGAESRPGLR